MTNKHNNKRKRSNNVMNEQSKTNEVKTANHTKRNQSHETYNKDNDADLENGSQHNPLKSSSSSSSSDSIIEKANRVMQLSGKDYITINDGDIYNELLRSLYTGFAYVSSNDVSQLLLQRSNFHSTTQQCLQALLPYYQYDIVMAGGKYLSRTFVRRTLIGEPGMTYKYLGLRLFAHAWRHENDSCGASTDNKKILPVFRNIYTLNQAMIQMTEQQVLTYQQEQQQKQQSNHPPNVPKESYQYNITLINYMEPSNETLLRDEEHYNMGKASVSWHADSSLQDNSCIGVYHTILDQKQSNSYNNKNNNNRTGVVSITNRKVEEEDWKIALRPNPQSTTSNSNSISQSISNRPNSSTTTVPPPIVVPTKSGDVYFLLDTFNHFYQHMVLAGTQKYRISSTHRVAVTETDTYQYISKQCSTSLVSVKAEIKKPNVTQWDISIILKAQDVLTEVEFEWIAQYWIQGKQHDVQHTWWQKPIRALEEAWNALERVSYKVYRKLVTTSEQQQEALIPRKLVKGLLSTFQLRHEMRIKWDLRRAEKIYRKRILVPFQPVEHPVFPTTVGNSTFSIDLESNGKQQKQLPKDLSEAIATLQNMLNSAIPKHIEKGDSGKCTKKTKISKEK